MAAVIKGDHRISRSSTSGQYKRAVWDTFAAVGVVRAFAVARVTLTCARVAARLIRAAGLRWPVEEDFEFGKDCLGLDQWQVRLSAAIARLLTTHPPRPGPHTWVCAW